MSGVLDKYFGIHAQAIDVWTQRAELLADNIANADTPNYKARDLDFDTILKNHKNDTFSGVNLAATQQGHFDYRKTASASDVITQAKYRIPLQSSLDGNTVDSHVEHSLFAENAIRHQVSLHFLNSKISGLVKTLRGE